MTGQITLSDYLADRGGASVNGGCFKCVCKNCMYYWSSRCPYGGCWDDHRAQVNPYDKAHPNKPPRTCWTNWDKPGEQAHWCRGSFFYPVHYCSEFSKYKGQDVQQCLKCNVSVFQDGYIRCSIVDTVGCQRCYEEFEEREK